MGWINSGTAEVIWWSLLVIAVAAHVMRWDYGRKSVDLSRLRYDGIAPTYPAAMAAQRKSNRKNLVVGIGGVVSCFLLKGALVPQIAIIFVWLFAAFLLLDSDEVVAGGGVSSEDPPEKP